MSVRRVGRSHARMYRLFENHGTKFLAVVGSLLMIAWIVPNDWTHQGNGSVRFGKLNGQEIDPAAVRGAQDAFHALNNVFITGQDRDGQPTTVPLPQAIPVFSPETLRQLQNDPLKWYLLVHEAEQAGVSPDENLLESALGGQTKLRTEQGEVVLMKDQSVAIRDPYREAARQAISVAEYFVRSQRAMKVSETAVNDQIAKTNQQLRVHVVPFKTDAYLNQVAAPTDDELATQFKAYADTAAGLTSTANPFGFGYQVPDRIQLQWISIPVSELTRSIEASKPAELWEEDAIVFYQKNQSSFQTSTTQPSAKPTTRPFAEAKADVLKQMQEPLVEQKRRAITNRITQQLQIDAKPAGTANPTTQQSLEAKTRYGVPYGSFDYLQKLSDDIQKQFDVKLTLVNQATPLSRQQLQAPDALGMTFTETYQSGTELLFSPIGSSDSNTALAIGQPSKPLLDLSGTKTTIVRVMAAEKAHAPASMAEVRAVVEKDLRQERATRMASDAAQKVVEAGRQVGGLAKMPSLNVLTSDWFGQNATQIGGLTEAQDYQSELVRSAFEALRGVTSVKELPKLMVSRYESAGTVVALEVFDVKTTLTTTDAPIQRYVAANTLMRQTSSPGVADEWFSMAGISQRIAFTPDPSAKKESSTPAGPAAPTAPASPFMP